MMMVSPSTLVYAFALFLGALAGYVLKRLSVFEIKEWRKRKREKRKWLDQVERTANGIQRAWHFSGTRPEEEDRERTADEMEELTDELKKYRKHQNATDEMVEAMNGIIERWDRGRDIVLAPHSSQSYLMRGQFLSDDAEELKELLEQERQGRIKETILGIWTNIRGSIKRIRRWWYQRGSNPMPYEIYRELSTHLADDRISEFIGGNEFLCIKRESITETVFYEESSDRYNIFHVDFDRNSEPAVIDRLPGKSATEDMLMQRLREAETVYTIPYEEIVSDGQSLKEFEEKNRS